MPSSLLFTKLLVCFLMLLFLSLAVDMLKNTSVDKIPNDLEGMESTMERLSALINDVYKYVDDVVVRVFSLYLFSVFIVLVIIELLM